MKKRHYSVIISATLIISALIVGDNMTSSNISIGDSVILIGGVYKGKHAVILDFTKKMVYIQFVHSGERKRIMAYNVKKDECHAIEKPCLPPDIKQQKQQIPTDNMNFDKYWGNIIQELQLMRTSIDKLIVLLHDFQF